MADEGQEPINKINFNINDGDTFYANEISITFGPAQFAFDFKNIAPRVDMRGQDDTKVFVLKHNTVLVDPYQVKQLARVLNDAIVRYEKELGPIEAPPAIRKAELELKKLQTSSNPQSHDVPSYFG